MSPSPIPASTTARITANAVGVIHRRRAQSNQLLPVLLLLAAIAVLLSYLSFPGEAVQSAARKILMPDF